MAELYLASASGPMGLRRRLALKKILPQFAGDPGFVEMFLSEARIASELSHPNLAQVYEVGEVDGSYFIAMEYVDGPNLRTLVAKAREAGKPLSPYLAARIVAHASDGLGYAHEYCDPESGEPLNIIHRDISPDNIIIARNGAVKVLDFGIAKTTSQSPHTRTGVVKGKLAYMAPEQMARKPMDHRADIYSLGVVLYELLAGTRPYDVQDDIALIHAIALREPFVPLATRRPGIPEGLCAIVEKALAYEPGERHATCRAFQAELEKFLHLAAEPIGTQEISRLVTEMQAEPTWGSIPASAVAESAERTPPKRVARRKMATPATSDYSRAEPTLPAAAPPQDPRTLTPPPFARAEPTQVTSRPEPPPDAVSPAEEPGRGRSLRTRALMAAALAILLVGAGVVTGRVLIAEPSAAPSPAADPPTASPPVVQSPPSSPPPPPAVTDAPTAEAASTGPPPPPAADAKLAPAILTVESIPAATVRVGGRQGASPFTTEVEPGNVKIEVYDSKLGFSKVDWLKLKPGERRTRQIKVARVEVMFRSIQEAEVYLDGRRLRGSDGDVTPISAQLYEGRHEVRFKCVNGQEDRKQVTVPPSPEQQKIDGKCAAGR